jgi:hypothetical protein
MYAYLGPTSNFADAKNATIYSAMDLFGACSFQVIQTINAWNAVGVESALGMNADVDVDCGPLLEAHNVGNAVTRRAVDRLSANCNITANGTPVDLYAGESVELLPGFNSGDRFLAMIDPCTAQARSMSLPDDRLADIARAEEKRPVEDSDRSPVVEFAFKVWPNPSAGKIYIRLKDGLYENYGVWWLEIMSTTGVSLATYKVAGDATEVDFDAPSGVYVLRVRQGDRNAVDRLIMEPR